MSSRRIKKVSFTTFLKKFPPVSLPVTLGSDTHIEFSRANSPLDPLEIEDYILPLEENEMDEFTEFIPCFCIPDTADFIGIVYYDPLESTTKELEIFKDGVIGILK